MKLVAGAIILLAAEQAYSHSKLIQIPNQEAASEVLIPASLVLAVLGSLLMLWGLLTEARTRPATVPSKDAGRPMS